MLPEDLDLLLIERCKRQERKAQYELYQQYAEAMFHVCLRICSSDTDAEDALQEAFVKAFKNIHRFQGKSTFGAWLKRIVINQCLDQHRQTKLRVTVNENLPEPEMGHSQALPNNLRLEAVKQSIDELPEGFRMVLTLYLLEGYDHQEIGEILGISPSTSKSQFSRAKAKLREIIKEKMNAA